MNAYYCFQSKLENQTKCLVKNVIGVTKIPCVVWINRNMDGCVTESWQFWMSKSSIKNTFSSPHFISMISRPFWSCFLIVSNWHCYCEFWLDKVNFCLSPFLRFVPPTTEISSTHTQLLTLWNSINHVIVLRWKNSWSQACMKDHNGLYNL